MKQTGNLSVSSTSSSPAHGAGSPADTPSMTMRGAVVSASGPQMTSAEYYSSDACGEFEQGVDLRCPRLAN